MHRTELSLAAKARARWGRSRCWEPGKVCALAPGTRASTAGQLSHRCLGSSGARAAGGAAALPLDRASCSPREPSTRHNPGCKQEVPGSSVCSGQARLLSLQPPDPSRHHLIRLRDGSCAHTAQIQISLPLPSSEHAIFAVCVCSRIFPGPESPRFLNRLRQLQRLRDKMSITLTRLLGKPKSEHSSTAGPRQEQGVLV